MNGASFNIASSQQVRNMQRLIVAWIATALSFVALDAIWLTQAAPRLDPPLIGEILAPQVELGPAIVFYLIYVSGIVALAVEPALNRGGVGRAAALGAMLGLTAYGSYDLTNQATLKVWDVRLTLADLAWGVFITASAAAAACAIASRIGAVNRRA
jgi:uncharacterized membrane protein